MSRDLGDKGLRLLPAVLVGLQPVILKAQVKVDRLRGQPKAVGRTHFPRSTGLGNQRVRDDGAARLCSPR